MSYGEFIGNRCYTPQPYVIATVAIDTDLGDEVGTPQCRRTRMRRWYCEAQSLINRDTQYHSYQKGRSQKSFWAHVRSLALRYKRVWIISDDCETVWGCLGVWDMIDRGDMEVQGGDGTIRKGRGLPIKSNNPIHEQLKGHVSHTVLRRAERDRQGVLITSPSCHAMTLRLPSCSGRILWLGSGNYGACIRDRSTVGKERCQELARFVREMCAATVEFNLSTLAWTSSSQAYAAWANCHFTEGMWPDRRPEIMSLEEAAYHGGRCECRFIGTVDGPCYHLDFRSMYPSVCMNTAVPVGVISSSWHEGVYGVPGATMLADCIAKCTVETPKPCYPLQTEWGVIYPVGVFDTVLAGPELFHAAVDGRIKKVHEWVRYKKSACLQKVARKLYELREFAESSLCPEAVSWTKSMLVGLVGKFGQRSREWIEEPDAWPNCWFGQWIAPGQDGVHCYWRSIAGRVQRECDRGLSGKAWHAVSAWITSAARAKLWYAIMAAGWDNVYYYDTDSLVTNETGYNNLLETDLMRNGGAGSLVLKCKCDKMEIHGIKYYIQDGKVTCAGVPADQVDDALKRGEYWRSFTTQECFRSGSLPYSAKVKQPCNRVIGYQLGNVRPDGWVDPIRIPQE